MRLNQKSFRPALALALAPLLGPAFAATGPAVVATEPAAAAADSAAVTGPAARPAATTIGSAATAPGSATPQIKLLHDALLESMKAGAADSAANRYRRLEPIVERSFDLPTMTAFAVGAGWTHFSAEQSEAAIAAFTRLTVASYVHNFRAFNGERFMIDDGHVDRGLDRIVRTHLLPSDGPPVDLSYRMRESGGQWKIIDVYYGAISQLATRRSDFAASLASGGAPGLIAHLNALSNDLLK